MTIRSITEAAQAGPSMYCVLFVECVAMTVGGPGMGSTRERVISMKWYFVALIPAFVGWGMFWWWRIFLGGPNWVLVEIFIGCYTSALCVPLFDRLKEKGD